MRIEPLTSCRPSLQSCHNWCVGVCCCSQPHDGVKQSPIDCQTRVSHKHPDAFKLWPAAAASLPVALRLCWSVAEGCVRGCLLAGVLCTHPCSQCSTAWAGQAHDTAAACAWQQLPAGGAAAAQSKPGHARGRRMGGMLDQEVSRAPWTGHIDMKGEV